MTLALVVAAALPVVARWIDAADAEAGLGTGRVVLGVEGDFAYELGSCEDDDGDSEQCPPARTFATVRNDGSIPLEVSLGLRDLQGGCDGVVVRTAVGPGQDQMHDVYEGGLCALAEDDPIVLSDQLDPGVSLVVEMLVDLTGDDDADRDGETIHAIVDFVGTQWNRSEAWQTVMSVPLVIETAPDDDDVADQPVDDAEDESDVESKGSHADRPDEPSDGRGGDGEGPEDASAHDDEYSGDDGSSGDDELGNPSGDGHPPRDEGDAPESGRIAGTVWLDDGDGIRSASEMAAGLAGLTVELFDEHSPRTSVAVTDDTGSYVFDDVAFGIYRVRLTAPPSHRFVVVRVPDHEMNADVGSIEIVTHDRVTGEVWGWTGPMELSADHAALPANVALIAVEDDPTDGQSPIDEPGAQPRFTISGRVWFDDGDGVREEATQSTDTGDAEAVGVLVELYDVDGTPIAATATRANGSYEFTDVVTGAYTIRIVAPDGFTFVGGVAGADGARDSDTVAVGFADGRYFGWVEALDLFEALTDESDAGLVPVPDGYPVDDPHPVPPVVADLPEPPPPDQAEDGTETDA